MEHHAPETLAVIIELKRLMYQLGMNQETLRKEMNKFLPRVRQIEPTHSGIVQISRWLDPTGGAWSEPKSEIILAFQKVIDLKKSQKKH